MRVDAELLSEWSPRVTLHTFPQKAKHPAQQPAHQSRTVEHAEPSEVKQKVSPSGIVGKQLKSWWKNGSWSATRGRRPKVRSLASSALSAQPQRSAQQQAQAQRIF